MPGQVREGGVNDLLGQALAYAGTGWPAFPCLPDQGTCPDEARGRKCRCKRPLTANGCLGATTDAATLRMWWRRWPAANVAIATGAPGPDVLDVDHTKAGSGWPALNRLKAAGLLTGASALIRTQSGGLHVYYTGSDQPNGSLPRHKLDFRSRAGYVLAPPSAVHGRRYELLDHRAGTAGLDWAAVKRLLDPPRRSPRPAAPAWDGRDLPPSVVRALGETEPADRSAALHRLVGACLRAGLDEGTIHELAAGYPPAAEKYGPRLAAEVERSMHRIGA
jgi:Bifunctional DNA primase/polymerase, N-terminal